MDKEYLSVKEFAAAAGLTPQAVYKKLNNQLKPYFKMVDGKKTIEKSALELFDRSSETTTSSATVEQQLINMLQTELNKKNEQIAELQKALDQEQRLHAMSQQRLLELEDKQHTKESKNDSESNIDSNVSAEPEKTEAAAVSEQNVPWWKFWKK